MTTKVEVTSESKSDWFKWLVVVFLIIAGLVANYYYNSQPWPLRLLAWLVLFIVAGVISLQTNMGQRVLDFTRESRIELRKIYWPTRQETIQTTLVIALAVVVLAALLWLMDTGLMWLIGWLTGQRG